MRYAKNFIQKGKVEKLKDFDWMKQAVKMT